MAKVSMKFWIARKILLELIKPWRWRNVYLKALPIIKNSVHYHTFSLNPNTKRYWNDRLSMFDNFWRNENYYHILDLFPKDREFSLIDIGCALGDGCELLQEKFPKAQITGVDISDVGIEKAKRKTKRVEYLCLDILREKLPRKYDYITIIETLEHFDNPFSVVDKCLQHAKKAVIISTPYKQKATLASEHRYTFNENTFANYKCEVVKFVDHIKVSSHKCIIYKITSDRIRPTC